MKENELRKHTICSKCGNKIGYMGLSFWTVKVSQHIVNLDALKRNAGMAMFLGSAELASVMGTDEDMTEQMISADITLCQDCALPIMELIGVCADSAVSKVKRLPGGEE